jgi:hypothetical protein
VSQPVSTPPYYQACTYTSKKVARKAYRQVQHILQHAVCALSAYRFLLPADHLWYVVIIGEAPNQGLHKRLGAILTTVLRGTPVNLDQKTLTWLLARRTQQLQSGTTWKEQHGITIFRMGNSQNDTERK